MATVFLPCESEDWWEDKKLFLLLMSLRSVDELGHLIAAHTRAGEQRVLSHLLARLGGLHAFLVNFCSPDEQAVFCAKTLPFIAKSASCLDERVPATGIPFLQGQEASALVLGRKLVVSLLANAFLCTFPEERSDVYDKGLRPFNFDRFFAVFQDEKSGRRETQAAKLKCILCYFFRMAEEGGEVQGVITVRRQVIPRNELPTVAEWEGNQYPLCPFSVDNSRGIEDAGSHTLQVDFANRYLGGSVLETGRVQEEIRFSVCPELLISMLIMDKMDDNEAVVISGFERFANYKGYGPSLEFVGPCTDTAEKDVFGNILSSLVAIDALPFLKEVKPEVQYEKANILRELNKAYIGFTCNQHRGDISTELLALKVRRQSTAIVGESYPDGSPGSFPVVSPSTQDALGNVNIPVPSVYVGPVPSISIPSSVGSDYGSGPLSPIVEVSESPRISITDPGGKPSAADGREESMAVGVGQFAAQLASSLFSEVVSEKPSIRASEKKAGVEELATQLAGSLLQDVTGKKPPSVAPQEKPVEDFAACLAGSLLEGVTSGKPPVEKAPKQDTEQAPSSTAASVDQLASSLASSILLSAPGKDARATEPSVAHSATEKSIEGKAATLSKSIISDILSETQGPSRPPQPPVQTVGQQTSTDVALSALATGLAGSIISESLSSFGESSSTPPQPTIFVESEKKFGVSESPSSSRSSSLTGQSLTLHEFTDELVESTVREGAFIAHVTQNAERQASELKTEIGTLAAGLVTSSLQDVLGQLPKPSRSEGSELKEELTSSPKSAVAVYGSHKRAPSPGRAAKVGGLFRHGHHRKRLPPSAESSDVGSDQEGHINPLLLSTPSSRMSYAWSTASTRDEDSRPVSPTDMDRIALGFATNVEEFASLFTDMLFSEAVAETTGVHSYSPRHKAGEAALEATLPQDTDPNTLTKGHRKISDFLSTLDQAESLSGGEDETDSLSGYVPRWHRMQMALLRPVATGNWGCGAFGGDPQLKAMIQWMAASCSGRPEVIYFPFKNKRLEKLEEVANSLVAKRWTVGQLCQTITSFSQEERKEGRGVFDAILEL